VKKLEIEIRKERTNRGEEDGGLEKEKREE